MIEEYDEVKHQEDIQYIASNLRTVDQFEVQAFGYDDYLEAIKVSIANAKVCFVVKGECPICVFGLSNLELNKNNAVWLLAAKDIKRYKKEFLKYSYLIINYWFNEFGAMYNYISVENKDSIRWLKWLGASFSEPFLIGGYEFKEFILDERSF